MESTESTFLEERIVKGDSLNQCVTARFDSSHRYFDFCGPQGQFLDGSSISACMLSTASWLKYSAMMGKMKSMQASLLAMQTHCILSKAIKSLLFKVSYKKEKGGISQSHEDFGHSKENWMQTSFFHKPCACHFPPSYPIRTFQILFCPSIQIYRGLRQKYCYTRKLTPLLEPHYKEGIHHTL